MGDIVTYTVKCKCGAEFLAMIREHGETVIVCPVCGASDTVRWDDGCC